MRARPLLQAEDEVVGVLLGPLQEGRLLLDFGLQLLSLAEQLQQDQVLHHRLLHLRQHGQHLVAVLEPVDLDAAVGRGTWFAPQ